MRAVLGRVRQAARELIGAAEGGVILLYHRVTDVRPDPQLLCVSPAHFVEHLEVLRACGYPTTLRQLGDDMSAGRRVRPRSVVVSFDDGYADNLLNAKPLLERHDVPATVFVAAGQVRKRDEFWWDELERLLLSDLGADNDSWNVLSSDDPTPRHAMYRTVFDRMRSETDRERRHELDSLRATLGADAGSRVSHRALTEDEVRRLQDGDLVEVGAHTMTHPVLSALPPAEQRAEISDSKSRLDAVLGRPTRSFSYPYGTRSDYTADTVRMVREAGFSLACSNFSGVVNAGSSAYELPRFVVRDWDGDEFARRLRSWFAH